MMPDDRFERHYKMFLKGVSFFNKRRLPLDEMALKDFAMGWVIPEPKTVDRLYDRWHHEEQKNTVVFPGGRSVDN